MGVTCAEAKAETIKDGARDVGWDGEITIALDRLDNIRDSRRLEICVPLVDALSEILTPSRRERVRGATPRSTNYHRPRDVELERRVTPAARRVERGDAVVGYRMFFDSCSTLRGDEGVPAEDSGSGCTRIAAREDVIEPLPEVFEMNSSVEPDGVETCLNYTPSVNSWISEPGDDTARWVSFLYESAIELVKLNVDVPDPALLVEVSLCSHLSQACTPTV